MAAYKNDRLNCFIYRKKSYYSGTEFIYTGECEKNGEKIFLNNERCKFLYEQGTKTYFQTNDVIYNYDLFKFKYNIVSIIEPDLIQGNSESEFYFTEQMLNGTVWYIVIMVVGTIFNDRILLWIFATIIYSYFMIKNSKNRRRK